MSKVTAEMKFHVLALRTVGIDPEQHVASLRSDVARMRAASAGEDQSVIDVMSATADQIEATLREMVPC